MKKYILSIILICYITFSMVSCAEMPSCESSYGSDNNLLFLGLYHGLISPFSVIGKIFGFEIGIYSTAGNTSYWLGFLFGLMAYGKLFQILGRITKEK